MGGRGVGDESRFFLTATRAKSEVFCFAARDGAFGSVVSVSCLESETGVEVCVDLHDHGNHNRPSHKSCSSIIGS